MTRRHSTPEARGTQRLADLFARVQHGGRGQFARGTRQLDLVDNVAAPEPMDLPAVGAPMDVLGLQEQQEKGVLVARALLACGCRPVLAFGGLPIERPTRMRCHDCDRQEWSGT